MGIRADNGAGQAVLDSDLAPLQLCGTSLPTAFAVGCGAPGAGAEGLVVMRIETVTGSFAFAVDPMIAKALGELLQEEAGRADSGLVVARGMPDGT